MKLFLMRHASAEYGPPDPERPLSPEGRRITALMADFITGKPFYSFSGIWSSPYLRARQTAEAFVPESRGSSGIKLMPNLLPNGNPRQLIATLNGLERSILIVGHNPHLSHLVQIMLEIPERKYHFPFKKSAIVALEKDSGNGTGFRLIAYVTPSSLGLTS